MVRGMQGGGRGGALLAAVVGLLGCAVTRAHAQEEGAVVSEVLLRAIVTPQGALVPLPAEVVCGPQVEMVNVSPSQNYAFVFRRTVYPARTAEEFLTRANKSDAAEQLQEAGAPEVQLLLWGTGSRRAATLWRYALGTATGYARIDPWSAIWLTGSDSALVLATVAPGPLTPEAVQKFGRADGPKTQTLLLRITAAKGSIETLATLEDHDVLMVQSPKDAVAIVYTTALVAGERKLKVLRVGASGPAVELPLIALNAERQKAITWRFFLPDGLVYGSVIQRDVDGKSTLRNVTLDTVNGAIRAYDKAEAPKRPGYPPPSPLPYTLMQATGSLTKDDTTAGVTPLWMQGSDPKESGRGLISADSDTLAGMYALTSAALYYRQGTLFATPLLPMPTGDLLARRREQYKKDALERAHMIGIAAESLSLSQGEQLPPPGDFARILQEQYQSDVILRNPATDKPGFTVAYMDTNIKAIRRPGTVVVGYLSAPGGRAVILYGGETRWEDMPTP